MQKRGRHSIMDEYQIRDKIHPKQHVLIAVKKEDGEEELHGGVVKEIITTSETHYCGIKVQLTDGSIGRVKQIIHGKH